jgi:hypothetical protein
MPFGVGINESLFMGQWILKHKRGGSQDSVILTFMTK